jgi:hypothetical protein
MTMAQLLRRVKGLPMRQRARLVREILALKDKGRQSRGRRQSRVTWPDVEARAKRIAGDRVLPNLVLLARGEESH